MNPREFVKEYSVKSLVCCFSGGKDSLVATHHVLRDVQDIEDLDRYVIFVNTGWALPGVEDYVKEVANLYDWPLTILHPDKPPEEHALEKGMPSLHRRWCCGILKLEPIYNFIRPLRPQRCSVTGLRKLESTRRRKLPSVFFHRKSWVWNYAPLIEWTDQQVKRYIKKHQLKTSPISELLGSSGECLCGVYSSIKQLRLIRTLFPEWFEQFVELEKKFRSGGSAFYLSNKRVYARDIKPFKTIQIKLTS